MTTARTEAFSDGVMAIIITVMVLELPRPAGADWVALRAVLPSLVSYVLSFVFIGIYWTNHHHMFHAAKHVSGAVLWANLHLLFWLSLVPFVTQWLAAEPTSFPTAMYGVVLLLAAIAYTILQNTIIRLHGPHAELAESVGRDVKGKLSLMLYLAAIPLAFVNPWFADAVFVVVALMWLVPDRRIESRLRPTST